ncbi:class I adenylate cyclase [Shewanella sp. WXL01]|uniref:class I adenylate cyclase n=1 Tax=Shewanella sp. WXL01 TaxID=2709721 RepID=UPI001FD9A4B0|nr:class I adenylate cyclase [Shewanella sp. WXL01]
MSKPLMWESYSDIAEQLNQTRLSRVEQVLPEQQARLLKLIPHLFQYNQAYLPGFHSPTTPLGVANYCHSQEASDLFAQFNWPRVYQSSKQPWAFEGIYAMGSTASFGQNPQSDVDVWLVHAQELSELDLASIDYKARLISQWFADAGFEVNFYLVHPKQFIDEQYSSATHSLGIEHSGSSQHWLLLEEFYRTHIRLAGKTVAWWQDACAINQPTEHLLFLGEVLALPASEYFGASLWQLYKSLKKPHKALLKVLLLETYTADYPNNFLITQEIWQRCLGGDFSSNNDAYLLLYLRIETYLLNKRDIRRLEIVRRCFYLKCGIRLSDNTQGEQDWRRQTMRLMVDGWNWPDSLLITLDDSANWHSGQLKWFNQQLNELLLTSYRTLLQFASKHELSDTLRVEELGLLARKLHAFFSEDEHQLLPLNPLWSQQVQEKQLTIVKSAKQNQYYLYREHVSKYSFMNDSALAKADNVCALMAWAAMNGIATEDTRWLEFERSKKRKDKLGQLSKQLIVPMSLKPKVSKRDLCQPCYFKKVIVVANLEQDPTDAWRGQEVMLDYMNATPLALGPAKNNMLGDVNIICLNSWGEWQSHQFAQGEDLLEAISYVALGIKSAPEDVKLTVISCASKLNSHIKSQLSQVFNDCQSLIKQVGVTNTMMYPLQLGKSRYGLYFNSRGMVYKKLEDQPLAKFHNYSQPACPESVLLPRPDLGDDPLSSLPSVVLQYITLGAEQFFLRQRGDILDVFLVDEHNQLIHSEHSEQSMSQLVIEKSREYVFQAQSTIDKHYFNMPQFFQLKRVEGDLRVVPFGISEEDLGSAF